jgi:hypothetical protein
VAPVLVSALPTVEVLEVLNVMVLLGDIVFSGVCIQPLLRCALWVYHSLAHLKNCVMVTPISDNSSS